MRAGVVVFPGSNCDRDMAVAFEAVTGREPVMVWHKETSLPDNLDIVGLPGGFSFGDYLRCGAIAAQSPVCRAVVDFANRGGPVLGICNGFQILTETDLLPGVLMRNSGIKFVCRTVKLTVGTADSPYTKGYALGEAIAVPVAHHDGNFTAEADALERLADEDRIAFRYVDNPNGSSGGIAGILSANRRILGMMPHPERAISGVHPSADGKRLFEGLVEAFAAA